MRQRPGNKNGPRIAARAAMITGRRSVTQTGIGVLLLRLFFCCCCRRGFFFDRLFVLVVDLLVLGGSGLFSVLLRQPLYLCLARV